MQYNVIFMQMSFNKSVSFDCFYILLSSLNFKFILSILVSCHEKITTMA